MKTTKINLSPALGKITLAIRDMGAIWLLRLKCWEKVGLLLLASLTAPVSALEALDDAALSHVDAQDGIAMQLNFGPSASAVSPGVGVSLDRLYWEDHAGMVQGTSPTGSDAAMRGYADNVTLYGKGMGLTMSLDFGSFNNHPGLNLDVTANIGTAFGRSFRVCDSTGTTAWVDGCGASLGALTLQTTTPLHYNLKTSDGLFSQTSIAYLLSDLRNLNVYWNQAINASSPDTSTNNQLILKNLNFSFQGTGYLYITDIGGFSMQTDCPTGTGCTTLGLTPGMTLNRVTDAVYGPKTLPGLNLEMMYKDNSGLPTDPANYSPTGAKGLIHLGVSGDMTSASLAFRGTDASGTTGDSSIFGVAYAANGTASSNLVMGSKGFALSFGTSFLRDGANPVTLELGHAGSNAFSVQFGNLSPLQIRTGCSNRACNAVGDSTALNTGLASFSTGNFYIDLTESKKMLMPQNSTLNLIPMGASFLTTNGTNLAGSKNEYLFDLHPSTSTNVGMLVWGIRNMNFNSVSRNSRFVVSNDVTDATVKNSGDLNGFYSPGSGWTAAGSSWGLGLPFYNVNADAAFYGTTGGVSGTEQRIGMGFALSTTGRSADGSRTTSILVIDGAPNANDSNNPTNYYVGLRNIDMYMAGLGSLGLNGDSTITTAKGLSIDIKQFTLALAGEVAAGYLPGAKVKSTGITQYAPSNSFALSDDVLFGLRLKLAGSTNLVVTPGDSSSLETLGKATNFPRLLGNLNLSSGALQVVEPKDGTILGFDNICGGNANGTAAATYGADPCGSGTVAPARLGLNNFIRINRDSVDFSYTLSFNPANADDNVFRIKDVEMFAANGTGGLQARQRWGEMVVTGGNLTTQMSLRPR